MTILGIESSCDDTAIGIIKNNEILVNCRYSQIDSVKYYGGVVPEVASRTHLREIKPLLKYALDTAQLTLDDIDIFAATLGPGLVGGLIVGTEFARSLAIMKNKIYIPVHHLEGHIFATDIIFPSLVLLISGGHSQLIYCKNFGDYQILCTTLDDALGELFDKVGRFMGLYGGLEVELCAKLLTHNEKLPIPMKGELNFSFSGLKTKFSRMNLDNKPYICNLLQNTVISILVEKVSLAYSLINQNIPLIVCGGVASNQSIRNALCNNFECIFPPINLCIDNGIMIAKAAQMHYLYKTNKINNFNLDVFSRMNLSNWHST